MTATSVPEPLLDVRGLNAWYGPAHVLFDVSFTLGTGEAAVLLGRNGAGKSTTLKALMGLDVRRGGEVWFAGRRIDGLGTHSIAQASLGFVPEDRRIFAGLTVRENLDVGRRPPRNGMAWTLDEIVRLFPNLGHMMDRPGGHMSGGEQQMLTIARTLMGNPSCILLDEPSEGLAPVILDGIVGALVELKRRGVTLLISEQNFTFARRIAERALIIEGGQIRFDGRVEDLVARPDIRERHLSV